MNKFVKYAAVGLAGYFIGFYEMKYKALKSIVNVYVENNQDDSKDEKEEEA